MNLSEFFLRRRPASLRHLLDFLADRQPTTSLTWSNWSIEPIQGGWNSLLYRAVGPGGDLAIKFTPKDDRDRAGREFQALEVLHRLGLAIAPRPVLLDREHYPFPVVVQEWMDDPVRPEPPETFRGWQLLSSHLALVHSVEPAATDGLLPPAVHNFSQAEAGRHEVKQRWERLPQPARATALEAVVERFLERDYPRWPDPQLALCRCDNNTLNFVRRPGGWASVDWENSGWGDPAFDVADLITHPAYLSVTADEWLVFTRLYLQRRGEPGAAQRMAVYIETMLVWWAIRLAQTTDELARGVHRPRLVARPPDWARRVPNLYREYLDRAGAVLASGFTLTFSSLGG